MIAHTRRRAAYDEIVEQFFAAKPDVLMGGGSAHFLPKGTPADGAPTASTTSASSATPATRSRTTATELTRRRERRTKLLGLFNTGNMDGALDRKFLKGGTRRRNSPTSPT